MSLSLRWTSWKFRDKRGQNSGMGQRVKMNVRAIFAAEIGKTNNLKFIREFVIMGGSELNGGCGLVAVLESEPLSDVGRLPANEKHLPS
jgi:hypothetical protein